MFGQDPGRCLICDAPQCACTPPPATDTVTILSQRDALIAATQSQEPPAELGSLGEPDPLPFTTSSYDRKVHGRRVRR